MKNLFYLLMLLMLGCGSAEDNPPPTPVPPIPDPSHELNPNLQGHDKIYEFADTVGLVLNREGGKFYMVNEKDPKEGTVLSGVKNGHRWIGFFTYPSSADKGRLLWTHLSKDPMPENIEIGDGNFIALKVHTWIAYRTIVYDNAFVSTILYYPDDWDIFLPETQMINALFVNDGLEKEVYIRTSKDATYKWTDDTIRIVDRGVYDLNGQHLFNLYKDLPSLAPIVVLNRNEYFAYGMEKRSHDDNLYFTVTRCEQDKFVSKPQIPLYTEESAVKIVQESENGNYLFTVTATGYVSGKIRIFNLEYDSSTGDLTLKD